MNYCTWTYKYIERGLIKYDTSCGKKGFKQKGSYFCPFCGRVVEVEKEPNSNKVKRGEVEDGNDD